MRQTISVVIIAYLLASTAAVAIGLVQIVNNTVPAGGFLLDAGGAGSFVRDNINPGNGRLLAR